MMKQLTRNQIWVLEELKRQGCYWVATATEVAWKNGETYYIDKRVNAKGVRRKFNQGNKEALSNE